MESIKQKGILEPLLVSKVRESENYLLIAGFRRFLAAKQLGLESVPVRILPELTQEERLSIQIIENIVRDNLFTVEIAEALNNYYSLRHPGRKLLTDLIYFRRKPDKLGEEERNTISSMLSIIGKKSRSLSNIVELLTLPDEILLEIKKKNIPISAGHLIVRFLKRKPERKKEIIKNFTGQKRKFSLKEIKDILFSLN